MLKSSHARCIVLAVASLFYAPLSSAEEAMPLNRASMLSNTCAGCHGPAGVSVGLSTPTIAGYSEATLGLMMQAFKADTRKGTVMNRIAKGYSDEDIKEIASFFAAQKFQPAKQDFDPQLAKKGKAQHEAHCMSCHASGGSVDVGGAGILAGQWKDYLSVSIDEFVSGNRTAVSPMMAALKAVQKEDGDDSFKALIEYYASQQ